jgi:RNA ligase (TIGR02306 family)
MSSLIVEVCKIDAVQPHGNADALELAIIKGWQCVVAKGKHAAGDLVTYIPLDAVIPEEHSDRWGITKYLSKGRVRCSRLRGEPSFGVIVEREDPAWQEGQDVAEHYGIMKYMPPVKPLSEFASDALPPHPLFREYTDVENMRHFPDLIAPGEEVVVTEKIHGTNSRIGVVGGELMAGSRSVRRACPEQLMDSVYWGPSAIPGVKEMLCDLSQGHYQVILFGEIYGSKVQNLNYGRSGTSGFQAFDLMLDGKYADWDDFSAICHRYGIPVVPVLYRGDFDLATIKALSEGDTTLGGGHIREGVVVKPALERTDPRIGRVCLKYIGDPYLFAKGITDSQDI